MPIKKTTPEGPKAKLMKQTIPALRKKAKALGVSDYTKRTKENLVQSIMLAEARKKRGTGMAGRKAKLKPVPQKKVGEYVYGKDGRRVRSVTSMPTGVLNTPETFENNYRIRKFENSHTPSKADKGRFAMRPGKRISKNGNVYYEYRGNRADASVNMHGPSKYQGEYRGYSNYATWLAVEWLAKRWDIVDSFPYSPKDGSDLMNLSYDYLLDSIDDGHPWTHYILLAYVNTVKWNEVYNSISDL